MELVIKKNVPLPDATDRRKDRSLYGEYISTFRKMDVGDFVEFPGLGRKEFSSPRVQAHSLIKERGWKFTTRKLANGYGIWRIA